MKDGEQTKVDMLYKMTTSGSWDNALLGILMDWAAEGGVECREFFRVALRDNSSHSWFGESTRIRALLYAVLALRFEALEVVKAIAEWLLDRSDEDRRCWAGEIATFNKIAWKLPLPSLVDEIAKVNPPLAPLVTEASEGQSRDRQSTGVDRSGSRDYDPQGYEQGDGERLQATLLRLSLLKAGEPLPPPWRKKSGMRGKSRVYFVFLPSEAGGINLVAKFDAPERAKREWDHIEKLYSVDMSLQAMLPIPGNRREDGVVIYRATHGATLSGHCSDLAEYLTRQLESAPSNCVKALELSLDILALFHQRGGLAMAQNGKVITWGSLFDTLPKNKSLILNAASTVWPQIDWGADRITIPSEIASERVLPNPLTGFESRLNDMTGQVMLSRVHGDLNLTNIVVGEDSVHAPASAFIIDLASCEEGRVTATDPARLETEFWHETFCEMLDPATGQPYDELTLLRTLTQLRDCLEGRPVTWDEAQQDLKRACLRFIHRLRERAAVSLRGNFTEYLLEDFFHCLYFYGINALTFQTVNVYPTRVRAALLGAALSLQTLVDLKGGRYGSGATTRLGSPLRPLSDMLPDFSGGAA